MKKLIARAILLFGLLLLLSFGTSHLFNISPFWGNIQLNTKVSYLAEDKLDPNIYFIGSSVTYRHIMPALFDSLTHNSGYSFNIGADGTLPPQTFSMLDYLSKSDTTIQYIFVELNSFDHFGNNIGTTKKKYYLKAKHLPLIVQYLYNATISLEYKLGLQIIYLSSYLENVFAINMRRDYIQEYNGFQRFGRNILGKEGDGFWPLQGIHTFNDAQFNKLVESIKDIEGSFTSAFSDSTNRFNKFYRKILLSHIANAKKKNIHLIYVLNPIDFVIEDIPEMVNLYNSLPEGHRIELANPSKYPEFYELENRWDIGHLNEDGAKLFTQHLSENFLKLKQAYQK